MRKGISVVLGFTLLAGAFFIAKYLIDNKNKPKPKFDKIVKTVFTANVENKSIPIVITSNGNLIAKNKIELYSEVQGVLVATSKEFKSGTSFRKGETIIKMNSDEFYTNLQAQKSNLFNALTAIMPDIRLDFEYISRHLIDSIWLAWNSTEGNYNGNPPLHLQPYIP